MGRGREEGQGRDREETENRDMEGATESQRNDREVPGKRQLTQI